MGYQVIWTDEAIEDLKQAITFIATDNPDAAAKFGEALIRRSLQLGGQPRLGRRIRELRADNIREFPCPPYRLIYEIQDAARLILIRVLWHGARREPKIL